MIWIAWLIRLLRHASGSKSDELCLPSSLAPSASEARGTEVWNLRKSEMNILSSQLDGSDAISLHECY
jgi:hypothetical protein